MIALGCVLAYLLVAVLTARHAMPALMGRMQCSKGLTFASICREYHSEDCRRPRGELQPRSLADAAAALGVGLVWPGTLIGLWLLASAPLASGEQTRLAAEQQNRIDKLDQELRRLTGGSR